MMQRGGHFLYEEARAHLSKDRQRWLACLSDRFNELIDHESMERNRRIADLQNRTQLAV